MNITICHVSDPDKRSCVQKLASAFKPLALAWRRRGQRQNKNRDSQSLSQSQKKREKMDGVERNNKEGHLQNWKGKNRQESHGKERRRRKNKERNQKRDMRRHPKKTSHSLKTPVADKEPTARNHSHVPEDESRKVFAGEKCSTSTQMWLIVL